MKLVTEASAVMSTFEKRDGQIRQKITSRKLMKKFDTKNNLILNLDIFVLGFYWEKIFLYYLNYLFTRLILLHYDFCDPVHILFVYFADILFSCLYT